MNGIRLGSDARNNKALWSGDALIAGVTPPSSPPRRWYRWKLGQTVVADVDTGMAPRLRAIPAMAASPHRIRARYSCVRPHDSRSRPRAVIACKAGLARRRSGLMAQ